MSKDAIDRALERLNAYREAYRVLYGEEHLNHSQFWYESGWYHLWEAQEDRSGWGYIRDRPLLVRAKQLESLTQKLQSMVEVRDEHGKLGDTEGQTGDTD